MWSRDLCIPRSIASSKKAGCRHVGMYTRLVVKRSFTSSRAPEGSNSRVKKRAGIDSASRSRKFDRPRKADHKEHKRNQGRDLEMKWFNILRDRIRALRQREDVINDIDRE